MELDTGASRTIMSKTKFHSTFTNPPSLSKTKTNLWLYGNVKLNIEGETKVNIKTKSGKTTKLVLLIAKGSGPTLLGRDWIKALELPAEKIIGSINTVNVTKNPSIKTKLQEMLSSFDELFKPGLGTFKDHKVSIEVQDDPQPRFCKARPVPYFLRNKVDQELDRLVKEGIIEPIKHSNWSAPIVPVLKANNNVRICGDFCLTVNKVIKIDKYPLPKHEELLSSLAGGKYFTKLDLSEAYAQLNLDDDSKQFTVINTHRDLFQYNRLSYGVASAPGIFQRTMEKLLRGKVGTCCFQDDILISGKTPEELIERLKEVLTILLTSIK